MNENTTKRPVVFTPAKLIILGVVMALAAILGIQYFLGDRGQRGNGGTHFSGKSPDIFKAEPAGKPAPGYNPARRPEPAPNANSLEMFTRTNEGYGKAYEVATATRAASLRQGKLAAVKPARTGAKKAAPARKVTPRIRPVKSFGTSGEGTTELPKGAGMQDISAIIKNASQEVPTDR